MENHNKILFAILGLFVITIIVAITMPFNTTIVGQASSFNQNVLKQSNQQLRKNIKYEGGELLRTVDRDGKFMCLCWYTDFSSGQRTWSPYYFNEDECSSCDDCCKNIGVFGVDWRYNGIPGVFE